MKTMNSKGIAAAVRVAVILLVGMLSCLPCSADDEGWVYSEHRSPAQDFIITVRDEGLTINACRTYGPVAILITDADGIPYYIGEMSMAPGAPVVIPIDALPAGEYCLQLAAGENKVRTFTFIKGD